MLHPIWTQNILIREFPPTEYDMYWVPGEREVLYPSAQQLEIFPDDKVSRGLKVL